MKLKLCCADFTFPLLPHNEVLSLIAMLGIKAVDIGLFEGRSHLQPSDQFRRTTRSAAALKKKLDDHGLKAADVFMQPANDAVSYAINQPVYSRRHKARNWFEHTLDYAVTCGARHVTTTPGVYFDGESRARSWANCCEQLAWRVERAKQQRIVFGVEPHIGSIVPRPKPAMRLIRDVPGLTYTLDYSYFAYAGISDRHVEPLIPHASHFHVRGARKGALQVAFKDNVIDFKRILKVMKKTGYRGYLCMEYCWTEWENCNRVDNLSETILFRDLLRWVKV